ncbi:MAG: hypothetical protein QOG64_2122 [Acidimicrobiaceae bacterium]|nr:hypothetical protein [Acidimicrobiaceae bacterium]
MVDGFEGFFVENYPRVVRALTLTIGRQAAAEEVAQEAFTRAFDRWETIVQRPRPEAWVYVVAMNAARDQFRRLRRTPARFDVVGDGPDHAGLVATEVTVRSSLLALPFRQRQAVVLRYFVDLEVADVAAAMGCSPGTVKSTLHAALVALHVRLAPDKETSEP